MTARSLSCCSRVLDRVSERQSSNICCFMLSTAASATLCFFMFCKQNKTTVYTHKKNASNIKGFNENLLCCLMTQHFSEAFTLLHSRFFFISVKLTLLMNTLNNSCIIRLIITFSSFCLQVCSLITDNLITADCLVVCFKHLRRWECQHRSYLLVSSSQDLYLLLHGLQLVLHLNLSLLGLFNQSAWFL